MATRSYFQSEDPLSEEEEAQDTQSAEKDPLEVCMGMMRTHAAPLRSSRGRLHVWIYRTQRNVLEVIEERIHRS